MAGHSKWANIRYRKGAQDKKRGKIFSKFIRAIIAAARTGIPDPSLNPRLRLIMDKAMAANMTKDTIDRAIKRASGDDADANMQELRYEGYGPNGVAVMVECRTDNRNRTAGEVRHAFSKCGGNLGTDGSVAYLFTKQGQIHFAAGCDENKIMEIALEAGAEDIIVNDDKTIDVITTAETLMTIEEALFAQGLKAEESNVTMEAAVKVNLEQESAEKMLKLIDMLEELDDVEEVYSNADISEEILQKL